MVTAFVLALALGTAGQGGTDEAPEAQGQKALAQRGFFWYDPKADGARAVIPPRPPAPPKNSNWNWGNWNWSFPDLGTILLYLLMAVAIAALIVLLTHAFKRIRGPGLDEDDDPNAKAKRDASARFESLDLAADLGPLGSDPFAQAKRLRAKGDLSGAVTWLFVHLLLTLDQRRLVRLAPGRTGRQLVRAASDKSARDLVTPTLRLFEAAYYGRRAPTAEALDLAWGDAEAFLNGHFVMEPT